MTGEPLFGCESCYGLEYSEKRSLVGEARCQCHRCQLGVGLLQHDALGIVDAIAVGKQCEREPGLLLDASGHLLLRHPRQTPASCRDTPLP